MTEETASPEIWDRVQELLDEGRLDEAIDEAEAYRAERPGSSEAATLVGVVRSQRGEAERAHAALDAALDLDPENELARLEKARVLLAEERFEDVLDVLGEEDGAEAGYLLATALYELGEIDAAEARCVEALAVEEVPELLQLQALLLLERAEGEEALAKAARAVELDDSYAEGHYVRGLALTQLGRLGEADESFSRAAALEPESYFAPFRLEPEAFDDVVDEALAELPEEFQAYLENVEVAVEDVPAPETIREDVEFDVLGIYQGGTIQSEAPGLPDRILLFQRNLENVSPDRETLVEEIRDTVFHEVGHHMGMDEEAVRAAEEGALELDDEELEDDELED